MKPYNDRTTRGAMEVIDRHLDGKPGKPPKPCKPPKGLQLYPINREATEG